MTAVVKSIPRAMMMLSFVHERLCSLHQLQFTSSCHENQGLSSLIYKTAKSSDSTHLRFGLMGFGFLEVGRQDVAISSIHTLKVRADLALNT
jgi:hypothetical protein